MIIIITNIHCFCLLLSLLSIVMDTQLETVLIPPSKEKEAGSLYMYTLYLSIGFGIGVVWLLATSGWLIDPTKRDMVVCYVGILILFWFFGLFIDYVKNRYITGEQQRRSTTAYLLFGFGSIEMWSLLILLSIFDPPKSTDDIFWFCLLMLIIPFGIGTGFHALYKRYNKVSTTEVVSDHK